uniref:Transposase n=1 Tax=Heterorhabditis bacteriophora TaxID=37862 RepID=A0A1I7WCW2_HETBA
MGVDASAFNTNAMAQSRAIGRQEAALNPRKAKARPPPAQEAWGADAKQHSSTAPRSSCCSGRRCHRRCVPGVGRQRRSVHQPEGALRHRRPGTGRHDRRCGSGGRAAAGGRLQAVSGRALHGGDRTADGWCLQRVPDARPEHLARVRRRQAGYPGVLIAIPATQGRLRAAFFFLGEP